MKQILEFQYIVRSAKLREFTNCIFLVAKKAEGLQYFELNFPKKLWKHFKRCTELLIDETAIENDEIAFVQPRVSELW